MNLFLDALRSLFPSVGDVIAGAVLVAFAFVLVRELVRELR